MPAMTGAATFLTRTSRLDVVSLEGRSGRRYDFRVYVWNTRFKPVPGVYVVLSRSIEPGRAARYEPVFVDSAEDVSSVLAKHPRSDCFAMYYANVIGVLKQPDPTSRQTIVDDLVAGLSPPCNANDTDLGS